MSLIRDTREVWESRELLYNLTMRELRGKYKGTALGWGWSLVNPLMTAAIYTLVFSTIMKVAPPTAANGSSNYTLFLLCGLLPWTFMTTCITGGMGALVGNANLIKKTYFPRRLLLVSNTGAALVNHLIEMLVLAVLLLIWRVNVLPWIVPILLIELLLAVFGLGLALMLSVINVYFRDTTHFVGIFIQLWFYATPVIYPITLVTQGRDPTSWVHRWHVLDIYQANPALYFIETIKDMLYTGAMPAWTHFVYAVVIALVTLWIGNAVFGRLEGRLAEEL
ncbi:ABC transporter permease [uncultured Actinomyces sp.]|uniref:ABC transporter permease n=1 Tax=uncultured Actinomyces sp. TaxID=249061 RepID=UPI00288AF892|nr:ABC transporter permease [uncultured Actinomyces sp.]